MTSSHWTETIEPNNQLFSLRLRETWRYRDLLWMFVVRDFVTLYKQTILGPIWFFIQPIFTTLTFTVIFGMMAGISTDAIPKPLFYLAGIICWNYFSECFKTASMTFRDNQMIFGKVYFPRIVVPLSISVSRLIQFAIQFVLFLVVYVVYLTQGTTIQPNAYLLLLPVLLLLMAALALGFGMIVTSLTTKYRDLIFLLQFGIQIWMYATPVIYPLSLVSEKWRWLMALNPMTSIIEGFREGFFGTSSFQWDYFAMTCVLTLTILLLATAIFNRTEKNFMDTV